MNKTLENVWAGVTMLAMFAATYLVFIWVPNEKIMGVVQKIFYFHVSSAWIGFFAFFVVFIAGIMYLKTRDSKWDWVGSASAEIGVVFTTIVLLTGPIWGRSAWGAWWTWDPRLTTTLVLWFVYVAYLLMRSALDQEEQRARLSAVLGIVGFLDVPLVWFSIRWWQWTIHPNIIESGGKLAISPKMQVTLMVSLLAFTSLYFYLLPQVIRLARHRSRLREIKEAIRGNLT